MTDSPPRNIAGLLTRAARNRPDSGLDYCQGGAGGPYVSQSYADLLTRSREFLAALRSLGAVAQDRVVLCLENPQEFLTAFWACVLGGLIPCPLAPVHGDPDRWTTQLRHVDRLLDRPLVLTDAVLAAELPRVDGVRVITLDALYGHEPAAELHEAAPGDTAVLVLTSGSTGSPKAVTLTHANLLAAMAGKNGYHRLTAADTTLNWISFDHVAALLECHLLPIYAGCRQLHVESAVILGEPLEFLRLVSLHGVTMTFTPNFLLGLLTASRPGAETFDLSRVRHIVSGGEAVVVATGRAFLDRFAAHGLAPDALWPAFGMTETCAGSIYSLHFPQADSDAEFANLGAPVEGLSIRVVDEQDRPVPAGHVGELQLSGPMISPGYHQDERATADSRAEGGWFRSGDLGRIDNGRLTLVGRSKDSVVVNGVSYFSHELEAALQELDGVSRSYVAAFPTRPTGSDTEHLVIAFHHAREMADEDDDTHLFRALAAVRATAVMHWGFRPSLILPLPKDAFPKTSLGKIRRALMRERLEAGAYDDVVRQVAELTRRRLGGYTAPEGGTEQALAEIYAELFDTGPGSVSAHANFFDLGGTSLDILRLRTRVAQRLGAHGLRIIDVLRAPTVRALAAQLSEDVRPEEQPYDPVVPMQLSGEKTPLFCVHPGVGEVLVFVNLAQYFVGDRPFYALRARGLNEGEKPFTSFAEMVETYVAAIRERQPHGPYAVAGYSFGGAVAFEIAKVLEAAGERVDFVGSFNLPPHIRRRMNELDFVETAVNLAFFLGLIDRKRSVELPGRLRGLPQKEQLSRLLDLAPPGRITELDLDPGKFGAWARLAADLTRLGRDYEPSGSVRSMTVFYAIPLRGSKEDWLRDELRRWDEHATGNNRYVDVPGEHYTLMGPRHVAAFQAVLRRELDRSMGDAEGRP
ncbi:peptide synthetase [Streptomyces globisporus C-1027]|uniref:Peptide synthetase n=1 Tax=Streptomyces globisporus C-1027 TaxID=1172567 RepID=A0A0U3KWS0_STRGL|nr:non-ribosomal peptide synthetase [Streptomyces globisporus]ALU97190.1 peptide synthetase [Streptomyces globisporus C-1027]